MSPGTISLSLDGVEHLAATDFRYDAPPGLPILRPWHTPGGISVRGLLTYRNGPFVRYLRMSSRYLHAKRVPRKKKKAMRRLLWKAAGG